MSSIKEQIQNNNLYSSDLTLEDVKNLLEDISSKAREFKDPGMIFHTKRARLEFDVVMQEEYVRNLKARGASLREVFIATENLSKIKRELEEEKNKKNGSKENREDN